MANDLTTGDNTSLFVYGFRTIYYLFQSYILLYKSLSINSYNCIYSSSTSVSRIFWIYSATELAVIILLELLPSLAIVALVSNNITTMEQYLATGQRSNLRTNIRQNTGKANYSSIEENTKLLIQPRG